MLKAASLFTDGAVLCRGKEIRIFGEVTEGAEVTARLTDRRGALLAEAAGAGREGRFLLCLPPQEAQSGCRLEIRGGGETAAADDVAIGDVYLAGGQSNMELPLCNADGGKEEIRSHDDPMVRFFNIPRIAIPGPEQKKAVAETRWRAVRPGEGGENSAVASFFAAEMRKRNPEVPVGIVGCSWGGTSVTCWIEKEELATLAEGQRYLREDERQSAGKDMAQFLREEKVFQEGMDRWNRLVEETREARPGAAWKEIEAVAGPAPWNPPAGPGSPYRPGGLAETMVREAAPLSLTAILYYQGENDASVTTQYDRLMELLIRSWREKFRDPMLPFLFVQLPMWLDWEAEDRREWARLRLAQAAARDRVRNTGMICLLDQGEYGNIHPTEKRPVGLRLAELAGNMLYGQGEVSPRALDKYTLGDTMTVRLSAPVRIRDGEEAALLEIAEEAGEYAPAEAECRGNLLLLRAEGIRRPARVRYAWTDYSDRVNLFGENGLPMEPFDL